MSRVRRPASAFATLQPKTKLQKASSSQQVRARRSKKVYMDTRVDVIVRDGRRCVRCGDIGVECHHRMNRGAGGSNADPYRTHQPSRLVLLCRDCHRWIGDNPEAAEADGLLVRRGVIRCDQVPLLYRGRRVLLTDDFQITDVGGTS